jgi:hypothetical protein
MRNLILAALCAFIGFAALCAPASAQGVTRICVQSIGANGSNNCVDAGPVYPFPVAPNSYPAFATPITGNAAGTTGAVVGTLANATAKTTYICGFDISALGGTATVGPVTVAGTLTSSFVYQFSSAAAGATLNKTFTPCIPASAANTPITVTTTADGSASAVDVNSWGYQQ